MRNLMQPGKKRSRGRRIAAKSTMGCETDLHQMCFADMESMGKSTGRAGGSDTPVILVAEDDALIRLCVAEHLRENGYEVVEACSGDEALAVFAASKAVDVVFSDVRMPGATDGAKLAHWVRENRPGTHVILASGYFPKAADEAGKDVVFIPKPYEPETVVRAIRAELKKGAAGVMSVRRAHVSPPARNWRLQAATERRGQH
jgi:CheY-like chemotaxis protein